MGSINLSEFVKDKTFDYDSFEYTVRVAVRALNEVLFEGLPLHPLQEQRDSVRDWRQIGLGIFGLADMLIKLEIPYDSNIALEFCKDIGFLMVDSAIDESACLAKKYDVYPNYKEQYTFDNDFLLNNTTQRTKNHVMQYGLCNSQLLTIAPTGTLSTMLGVSGGIEPIYANSYTRKTESLHGEDVYYKVYTPIVDSYMKEHGLTEEEQLPEWFVTSGTINPFMRVKMQGTWQKYIDASISSTVNLPNEATVEEIGKLYMEAWANKLKGLTIFRDGCKRLGILSTSEPQEADTPTLKRGEIIQCSDNLIGRKRKICTGCGSQHILAYFDPITGEMQEVYLNKGSTGGCSNYMTGLSRTISLLCRAGVDVFTIKDQLDSTGACPSYAIRSATKHDTSKGSCCPMAVGNALVEMWEEVQNDLGLSIKKPNVQPVKKDFPKETSFGICPECGEPLVFEGGCNSCKSCGYSKCS